MSTFLADVRETLAPRSDTRHGPLSPLLVVMTAVTGLVDAFSFLALGRIFVANMTGNIIFLGFALAVPDLPTTVLTLTLIGVPADSQLVGGSGSRAGRRLIAVAAMLLGALIGALLLTHGVTVLPLVIATILVGGVAIATHALARANPPWVHASPADEAKRADQTDSATDVRKGGTA